MGLSLIRSGEVEKVGLTYIKEGEGGMRMTAPLSCPRSGCTSEVLELKPRPCTYEEGAPPLKDSGSKVGVSRNWVWS